MNIRTMTPLVLCILFACASAGCRKAESPSSQSTTGGEPIMTREQMIDAAKAQTRAIAQAIQAYITVHKDVPPSLELLIDPDKNGKTLLEGGPAALTDPWGKEYEIEISESAKEGLRVTVWTATPEGLRIESATK